MGKPTALPIFNTNETDAVAPDTARQDDGFIVTGGVPEKPSYKLFNYLMNSYYKWLGYFSNREKTVTHNIAADTNYTLTSEQNDYGKIIITDTGVILTAARDIVVDTTQRRFLFTNDTAQTLTVKIAGVGVDVLTGETKDLYNDGTDISESAGAAEISGVLSTDNFIHVQDQKPNGTDAGSSVAGFQTRDLNTVLTNTITGASLAANEITLPAGTYFIDASAPAFYSGHQTSIYNVTDATALLIGESSFSNITNNSVVRSGVKGVITLAATKNISLRHYFSLPYATEGLGNAISSGDGEVYSEIKIWKVG